MPDWRWSQGHGPMSIGRGGGNTVSALMRRIEALEQGGGGGGGGGGLEWQQCEVLAPYTLLSGHSGIYVGIDKSVKLAFFYGQLRRTANYSYMDNTMLRCPEGVNFVQNFVMYGVVGASTMALVKIIAARDNSGNRGRLEEDMASDGQPFPGASAIIDLNGICIPLLG